jgi:hypothetical protein
VTADTGLIVAGAAVIVTGHYLKTMQQALLIAARTRKLNGLPVSAADKTLAEALTCAMAAHGQTDVLEPEVLQHYPQTPPTVPLADAAKQLRLSRRHTRRLAPKLGGKKIAGVGWLLDQTAIDEHMEGKWTAAA